MQKYRTKDGDVLDKLCDKFYGNSAPETLRILYNDNYRLSDQPVVLPAGLLINIPHIEQQREVVKTISLWD